MKIDGKEIAQEILGNIKKRIEKLRERKIIPKLAIILVGNDPASLAYVKQKELKAKEIGAKTTTLHLPNKTSQISLIKTIQQFNNDSNIHGVIVQQPLPQDINLKSITNAIDPKKDVDGFNPNSEFEMPIAMAVMKILRNLRSHLRGGASIREMAEREKSCNYRKRGDRRETYNSAI
jgi:methylenetetrahydrofolate dehydrogenase (NADP+)/methenyltetrahydrofolate cyclohydrolase